MSEPKPLSFHDQWIRVIGYAFLGIPIIALAILVLVLINLRESLGAADLAIAAFMVVGCLPFLAIGRWLTSKYRAGQRSGF